MRIGGDYGILAEMEVKAVNLKVGRSNGREYLSIVHGIRDPITHRVRTKTIQSLGYLDVLQKEYSDPVAHFKQVVEQMNQQSKTEKQPLTIRLDPYERLKTGQVYYKNLGYAPLSLLYHELGLDVFFRNHTRKLKVTFNVNNIVKRLVFGRILDPSSKKKTVENKDWLFENHDYTLDDVYRCLTFLPEEANAVTIHIHKKVREQYGRVTEPVYYDVTNYYFEIDEQDEIRRKGVSKEHRPNPIVQMGLLMDNQGIPIAYKLFPGNTNDCETLIPILREVKREFEVERLIVVADKGMNTTRNIVFNLLRRDGYVYSQTVRGADKELQGYVLEQDGYRNKGEDFRIKSRVYPRKIKVEDINGKKQKVDIDEKQVAFYSRDYDRRAKAEREPALLKARDLVNNPSKYNQATSYGAARYLKNLSYDKETGEVITTGRKPVFDEERLKREEQFDGYYVIISSETTKTDEEIVEIYRGLWKIEESFKVTKSSFHTRPVYLSRQDHIQAHFLICFIALVITRLLEKRLANQYPISRIAETLRQVNACFIGDNLFAFHFADEVTHAIHNTLGIDLEMRFRSLGDIKKMLGTTKKTLNPQQHLSIPNS